MAKIVLTGSTGFVGSNVERVLLESRHEVFGCSRALGVDVRDPARLVEYLRDVRPELVVHCAAHVGGIGYVGDHAIDVFHDNLAIGEGLLKAMRMADVRNLLTVMPNCTYPGAKDIYREDEWWDGPIHDSVVMYGLPRKMLWGLCKVYGDVTGLHSAHLVFPNMYGPGDHFDPLRSHALGALIAKIVQAREKGLEQVEIWGTGKPVREWMFVEDAARAIAMFVGRFGYDRRLQPEHAVHNVGIARGVSILELAEMIRDAAGWSGEFHLNDQRPDGAPTKLLDGQRFSQLTGWKAETPIHEGIRRTVEWYEKSRTRDYSYAH